jgi:hypothetical protein
MWKLLCVLAIAGQFAVCVSSATVAATAGPPVVRRGFLGAFFRPAGPPPFGVFSVSSKQTAPDPYPAERTALFGKNGYCDAVAANGYSISSGYLVDAEKLRNIVDLGVRWARMPVSSDNDDTSHLFGPGRYAFADADSAQCALLRAHITPIVGLEAGPVNYNLSRTSYVPKKLPRYATAADFGQWCGALAEHERRTFRSVLRYSAPGNEVNHDPALWPDGDAQIAAYTIACYRAIKAAEPRATVYAFELDMDQQVEPSAFVRRMYALGCRPGTCYDAISLHLYLRFGAYTLRSVADIRKAAHAPGLHILIGETGFFVPASVPDEAAKATATVEALQLFASDPLIDGVNYANVDECGFYPSGYFAGGCLVDALDRRLPAYAALRALAARSY